MGEASKNHHRHVFTVLEAIKKASKDLQNNPIPITNTFESTIKSLLDLENEANSILSTDPTLLKLSPLLNDLKTLLDKLETCHGYTLKSFLRRRLIYYEASRVAGKIFAEIQAWVDREILQNLVETLQESEDEDEQIEALNEFETRVSQGFDRDLQDLILKKKIFTIVESLLCDSSSSRTLREKSAVVILSLARFNKDVFVGFVLMGPTVRALISMASSRSLQVLTSLVKLMKSPLIDEIECNGGIPEIINLLSSQEFSIQVAAMDCIMEIGYFGRREAIEAMIGGGVIEKLMELQRWENGGDSIDEEKVDDEKGDGEGEGEETESEMKIKRFREKFEFRSCVARFAVQLEVGEGLRKREKREFKLEILKRVRESSVSDAEAATIVAEVLWGSSP